MAEQPIPTTPPGDRERQILQCYTEEVARQAERMDALGRQLITLELAVPGLYATLLKLVTGDKAPFPGHFQLYAAFGCWALALVLSLCSLVPRSYEVDRSRLEGNRDCNAESMTVMDFFCCSARFKRRLLIPSALLLFCGIFIAVVEIL